MTHALVRQDLAFTRARFSRESDNGVEIRAALGKTGQTSRLAQKCDSVQIYSIKLRSNSIVSLLGDGFNVVSNFCNNLVSAVKDTLQADKGRGIDETGKMQGH